MLVNSCNASILSIDSQRPDKKIIRQAATILNRGGLVVFPTETVYGIACEWNNPDAEELLYQVKERDRNKPFTIHISSVDIIDKAGCVISDQAKRLIKAYWPGPLTLILPLASRKGKLGFRLPDHPVALSLIDAVGGTVLAPSANKSGQQSPVTAQQAFKQVGTEVDLILDSGKTGFGKESTIVDCSGDHINIVRVGALSEKEICNILHL